MIVENLSTLKIHKMTQAQYDRELAAGRIDENAIYLTPDEQSGDGTVLIVEHNASPDSHSDIRQLIQNLSDLVNALSVKTGGRIFCDENEPSDWSAGDLWFHISNL